MASLPRRYLREMGVTLSRSRSGARDEVATRTTSRNRTNGRRRRPQLRSSCACGSAQGCRDALAQTRRRGGAGAGCGRARAPIRATALSLAGGRACRGASSGGRGPPAELPCAPSDLRPPAIAAAERLTGLHPSTASGPIDAAENDEKHEDDDPSCRVQCPHPFLTGRDTNLRSITPSNRHFHWPDVGVRSPLTPEGLTALLVRHLVLDPFPDDRPKGWPHLVEGAPMNRSCPNTLRTWRSPAAKPYVPSASSRST